MQVGIVSYASARMPGLSSYQLCARPAASVCRPPAEHWFSIVSCNFVSQANSEYVRLSHSMSCMLIYPCTALSSFTPTGLLAPATVRHGEARRSNASIRSNPREPGRSLIALPSAKRMRCLCRKICHRRGPLPRSESRPIPCRLWQDSDGIFTPCHGAGTHSGGPATSNHSPRLTTW